MQLAVIALYSFRVPSAAALLLQRTNENRCHKLVTAKGVELNKSAPAVEEDLGVDWTGLDRTGLDRSLMHRPRRVSSSSKSGARF